MRAVETVASLTSTPAPVIPSGAAGSCLCGPRLSDRPAAQRGICSSAPNFLLHLHFGPEVCLAFAVRA